MALPDVFEGTRTYLLDTELADAFTIARFLGKPLLLEGEPGTGKTKLAQEFAEATGNKLFEFPVTSGSKIEHLISRFDDVQRLTDAQLMILNAQLESAGKQPIDLQGRDPHNLDNYIILGPLALAYQTRDSVLLLDEIDKAPREFPNNLLYALNDRKVIIPETRRVIEAAEFPVIIITSNHEQDLPAPFVRRCVYHYIQFPDKDRMRKIVRLHYPDANQELVGAAINIFYQLRDLRLVRKPSTSEILDWVGYLKERYGNRVPNDLSRLPGDAALLKHQADLAVLKEIKRSGIESYLAANGSRGLGH